MNVIYKDKLLGVEEVRPFFHLLKENIARSRLSMTVVFIKAFSATEEKQEINDEIQEQVQQFLRSKVRDTDLLFKLDQPNKWGILLMQSAEKDATAFLHRIFNLVKDKEIPFYSANQFALCAMAAEIKTNKVDLQQLINDRDEVFQEIVEPWKVEIVTKYRNPEPQDIKVSIIENNDIFRGVLKTTIEKIQIKHFVLEIAEFADGYEFLESGRHLSSHTHIVIMNDILPKKNGIEVLDQLRSLPNQKKFIIYMMTKRNSQTDIISAYESGADEYLKKPFDLRLFKAQLLRTLERLQS
ncbi:response regulator [Lysinibacillus yapensis]|uniref:Response regulator n=1 Tax=Ureibacillus yapensis TaxID=2304605 RepID=A0A396SHE9_9BACL|nr:response regulator [Lysinibacillus yapensis]RHW39708.1 response regulator [Lysinibacillus yapensis]